MSPPYLPVNTECGEAALLLDVTQHLIISELLKDTGAPPFH